MEQGISYQNNNQKLVRADYIYHQNEKGKTCEMDLPFLENDITNILEPQKPVIYSRYLQAIPIKKQGHF